MQVRTKLCQNMSCRQTSSPKRSFWQSRHFDVVELQDWSNGSTHHSSVSADPCRMPVLAHWSGDWSSLWDSKPHRFQKACKCRWSVIQQKWGSGVTVEDFWCGWKCNHTSHILKSCCTLANNWLFETEWERVFLNPLLYLFLQAVFLEKSGSHVTEIDDI